MRRRAVGVLLVAGLLVAGLLAGCGSARVADRSSAGAHASLPAPAGSAAPRAVTPPVVAAGSPARAVPKPKPSPCARNVDHQLVLVSIAKQRVWMCARHRVVYTTPVTTGAVDLPDESTPTGTYAIQPKNTDTTLTLVSGAQYQVKYWIPFDAPLYGFHDSSWQHFPYGSPEYRTEGSHGCVHMPLSAMKFLYDWADVGATVTIRA